MVERDAGEPKEATTTENVEIVQPPSSQEAKTEHDAAKAELMSDGKHGEEDEEFQDALDEVQFAQQFDRAENHPVGSQTTEGQTMTENGQTEDGKEGEEGKTEEEEEPFVEQSLDLALASKQEGNTLFKEKNLKGAINKYSLAIAQCPFDEPKQKAMMHNNLGMVLMKLHDNTEEDATTAPEAPAAEENKHQFMSSLQKKKPKNANRNKALEQAKDNFAKAIELDSEYIKPVFQRMQIFREEEEYEEAVRDAKRIEELDPAFKNIRSTIRELETLQKEKFDKMKDEVVGGLKSLGNMFLGNFGMSVDNFAMAQNNDGTYNIQYKQ